MLETSQFANFSSCQTFPPYGISDTIRLGSNCNSILRIFHDFKALSGSLNFAYRPLYHIASEFFKGGIFRKCTVVSHLMIIIFRNGSILMLMRLYIKHFQRELIYKLCPIYKSHVSQKTCYTVFTITSSIALHLKHTWYMQVYIRLEFLIKQFFMDLKFMNHQYPQNPEFKYLEKTNYSRISIKQFDTITAKASSNKLNFLLIGIS